MRWLVCVLCFMLAITAGAAKQGNKTETYEQKKARLEKIFHVKVTADKCFATDKYHLDICLASPKHPKGQTVHEMHKANPEFSYMRNGGFFSKKRGTRKPIGRRVRLGQNLTVCSLAHIRRFIYQTSDGVEFSSKLPETPPLSLTEGIGVVINGKSVFHCKDFKDPRQGFPISDWAKITPRNIACKFDSNLHFMTIEGKLRNCCDFLEALGVDQATCLDSGSSTDPSKLVTDAIGVKPIGSKAYKEYMRRLESNNWPKKRPYSEILKKQKGAGTSAKTNKIKKRPQKFGVFHF